MGRESACRGCSVCLAQAADWSDEGEMKIAMCSDRQRSALNPPPPPEHIRGSLHR